MKRIIRIKHKCFVPGCPNCESYSISRGSNGSICICERCLEDLASEAGILSKKKRDDGARRKKEKGDA